jgi:hypothetical protein
MTASTPEEIEAYRLLALRAGLKLESVGLKTSKGKSAFSIVKKMTGLPGRSAKELLPLYEDLLREYGILSLKKTMTNPRGREIGSHPAQGKYTSFKKWADAVKRIGGRLRSESPVPQVVYGPLGFVSEWNGRSGKIEEFFDPNPVRRHKGESERKFVSRCMSEEKMSFPKQKQRIAVCLSKARKNPFNDRNLDA